MIALSSTAEFLAALRGAREVTLAAYTLHAGRVLDALAQAAKRGAHVCVRLEGAIYEDNGTVSAANADAAERLRAAGADVQLVHANDDARDAMLHCKAAFVDGALFLDDRNWPDDGGDTILRDDFARDARIARDALAGRAVEATEFFAATKRAALASEARLLREAGNGSDAIVESESFGAGNRVYDAIDRAARAGAHARLLVNDRDLEGNANEERALKQLVADGVAVRVCDGEEKFAIVSDAHGWIGSSNASAAFDHPDQIDWGMRTDAPDVLAHLRRAFDERWIASEAPAFLGHVE